jgi:hypothetical protein
VGVGADWLADVSNSLKLLGIAHSTVKQDDFTFIKLEQGQVVLNLISMRNDLYPELLLQEQQTFAAHGSLLVQLWEDVWLTKKDQVTGRIISLLGRNETVHGRKTNLALLDQEQADDFLIKYHLQGSAKARYKFGLIYEEELVAVATFSATRLMKFKGPEYRSSELIRFACKSGITVTGGFTKLLMHYTRLVMPNDLMSYADRDWSLGAGYEKAGFKLDAVQPPAQMFLDLTTYQRYNPNRLPEGSEEANLLEIFNTGNLKYILHV